MSLRNLFTVLALMSVSAALVLLFIRTRKKGGRSWRPLLFTEFSLLCFVLGLVLSDFWGDSALFFASSLGFLGTLILISSVPVFLRDCLGAPAGKGVRAVYLASLGLCFTAFGISFFEPTVVLVPIILQFASLVHLLTELIRRHDDIVDPLLKRVFRDLLWLGLPALPFLIVDPLGSVFGWSFLGPLVDNYSLPLFFVALNAILSWRLAVFLGLGEAARSGEPDDTNPETGDRAEIWQDFGLSARELDIARLLALGKSAKEIASDLGISPKTAENHTYRLYAKLGVKTRFEFLSRFAVPEKNKSRKS